LSMLWGECFTEQFSKDDRKATYIDAQTALGESTPNRTIRERQYRLNLEHAELTSAIQESYTGFDWNACSEVMFLLQQEAERFYSENLLADDFLAISNACTLDLKVLGVLAIGKQLLLDFGDRVACFTDELYRLQELSGDAVDIARDLVANGLDPRVGELVAAWKQFLLQFNTLEGLSRDIKLAYSPLAVESAKLNQKN
ncbi:hypothetical protein N9181_01800, partial [bacterium]|nr:hypothetical protein [bacterium]